MSIATLIKTIQDIMRKDVGVDGDAQRISQIVWLLFLKIFDDKEQEWLITVPGYKSPLQSRFRWSNWAKDPEGETGEDLIDFINNDLFPALKKLATIAGVSPYGKVVGSVFEDAYNYMKSGHLLRQVINTIETDVDFNSSSDRHLFNDIYEKDYGPRDRVNLVITNPPFGGMEEDGIENNFPRKYQTRETADLFMALIMHLLKPDSGRAAVVLPDGFLFGEGTKTNLKRELLEEFNLHTIVRLPKGVFSPYTSINTNILFFEKGGPTKDLWFFEHPYPEGYKSYSRRNPLTIQEFDREKTWWGGAARKGRKVTEYAWKVSAKEIAARNYNLDCKNPYEVEINHRDPEELMVEYQKIVGLLEKAQSALKQELMAALGDGK
jgi:type I restriction-modification system DNA methylase subunit